MPFSDPPAFGDSTLLAFLRSEDYAGLVFLYCGLDSTVKLRALSRVFKRLLDHTQKLATAWNSLFQLTFPTHVLEQAQARALGNRAQSSTVPWATLACTCHLFHRLGAVAWVNPPSRYQNLDDIYGIPLEHPYNNNPTKPRSAHAMVTLGEHWMVVYGGFGGTSWGGEWGLLERSEPFAFRLMAADEDVANTSFDVFVPEEHGSVPIPRYGHSLTPISVGRAILFGGFSDGYFRHSLDDVHTLEWKDGEVEHGLLWQKQHCRYAEDPQESARKVYGRGHHGHAYHHESHRLYVFGGICDGAPVAELMALDTATWEWSHVGDNGSGEPPAARYWCSLTMIEDRLFCIGGATGADYFNEGEDLLDMHIFDMISEVWSRVAFTEPIRDGVTMAGTGVAPDRPETLGRGHTAVRIGTKILLFGGFINEQSDLMGSIRFAPTLPLTAFDTDTYTWVEAFSSKDCDIPWERFGHACVLHKGFMYVHGGWTFETRSTVADLHVLDLAPKRVAESVVDIEVDPEQIHPVAFFFSSVSPRALLASARARARVGSGRVRQKQRNCYMVVVNGYNYFTSIVAICLSFVWAIVPSFVGAVIWRISRRSHTRL